MKTINQPAAQTDGLNSDLQMPGKNDDNCNNNPIDQGTTCSPEHYRKATLNTLDPSFVGIDHKRKTGRMIDHEPGSRYNL